MLSIYLHLHLHVRMYNHVIVLTPTIVKYIVEHFLLSMRLGKFVFYAIFQPCLVIYGGQFPQLGEQIVPGSEPATLR